MSWIGVFQFQGVFEKTIRTRLGTMIENIGCESSLEFVVNHWSKDAFDARRDWRELGLVRLPWWRRHAAAAAICGVVLAACAALGTWVIVSESENISEEQTQPAATPVEVSADPMTVSRRIEFSDASLQEVADAVAKIYGVRLENLPSEAGRVTLSYEGTAPDLVETLNFMLGSSIRIAPLSEVALQSESNAR